MTDEPCPLCGTPLDHVPLQPCAHHALFDRYERLVAAVTPSAETKAAYMGEFTMPFPVFDPDGSEVVYRPNVPWVTIKQIMRAIWEHANA